MAAAYQDHDFALERFASHLSGQLAQCPPMHVLEFLGDFTAKRRFSVCPQRLDRIGGAAAREYGVRLEPDQLDARIESIRTGLERYAEENPDDLGFLRKSLARFQR